MADEKKGRALDAFLTIPGWLDWLAKAWPLLGALFGASALSWLASAAIWLNAYGPLAWGLVFLITFLVLYGIFLLGVHVTSKARERRVQSAYTERVVASATVNPLDRLFAGKRIDMRDFYHPFFKWHVRPTFRDSEVYGPANVALRGSPTFERCLFHDCEIVIVRPGVPAMGVIGLDSPVFEGSQLYRLTFFVTAEDAGFFTMVSNGQMRIVSQGEPIFSQAPPQVQA
ncbi:hypothetical protein [Brevundimonas sp.]|uniref:hypothetical protein n=1 Tax=Brevundimonas sp. TaxID=1871086 RepID=UPI0035131002